MDSQVFSKTCEQGFSVPGAEPITVETDGKNPQHEGIINNFANAILGLEPQFVDGREGIRGVELMNAIELSGWKNGEEISLPVNEEEYLGYLNAHRKISRYKKADDNAVADTTGTFESKKI